MKLLDIDLDFFLDEISQCCDSDQDRLPEKSIGVRSETYLRNFLEKHLGLSSLHKLPATLVDSHDRVLDEIVSLGFGDRHWVVHVDAHGDMGYNTHAQDRLIYMAKKPMDCRRSISLDVYRNEDCETEYHDELNEGNYLLYAVFLDLLERIDYVYHEENNRWSSGMDLPYLCVPNIEDDRRRTIKIPRLSESCDLSEPSTRMSFPYRYELPESKSAGVPLALVDPDECSYPGDFDYVFLAQSKKYTPPEADVLLGVFAEYLNFEKIDQGCTFNPECCR